MHCYTATSATIHRHGIYECTTRSLIPKPFTLGLCVCRLLLHSMMTHKPLVVARATH